MATVSLLNVNVRNNPAAFNAPYEFEITFECLEPLQKDLEWKLTYVGSATSSDHDQELDSLLVGPIPVGVNKFVFEADPPNTSRIPASDILGVTVILLSCSYDEREFVRVGYYVNNEYTDPAMNEEPPAKPDLDKIRRNILADKPRVTRFQIKWDSEESAPSEFPPEQPDVDQQDDDEEAYAKDELEEEAQDEGAPLEGDAEALATAKVDEDAEMEGADGNDKGEESDAASEDLEAESEDDEDDEEEEEEGTEENGDAMDTEMGDSHPHQQQAQQPADVMVH
ncbi:Histone chaperone ASF1 [Fulvia fulva]|uniref:Histone chaperone n=1 Tax=Passalora fulva TaxID=5499 RepID=A0A9Q8UVJ5_PASFU|nr:Histone chaperone ASF1 [Fulvia fulva]KAK4612257.1 Histone chaperone ASF1 [Fulvia fulva]KAK4613064.1 Histone chaperone ASF1 [Fulvia fulva]UJO24041.1 Histone chaperone ASF1 [Fulvia fulva]WPV21402.1 Histone chaperone ASF1 [Fulvia fulva]WPV36557.1 Histone chaperone ASF1 [Fulvia fulva]